MSSIPGPAYGPCVAWCDANDVAACCNVDLETVGPALLDEVAFEASMALYEISGRQFTGLCGPVVVRPGVECSCFGPPRWNDSAGPWGWMGSGWENSFGESCGCGTLTRVKLNGYPIREIVQVKIDGAVVSPADYMLVRWRYLAKRSGHWPACQDFGLADTEPGTFSVSYLHGSPPPMLGIDAAAQLACQLYLACSGGSGCSLPAGVTKVDRQGITVERGLLVNWLDPTKPTGMVAIDTFLRSYWSRGKGRRPAVWSPDTEPYPRREGI